MRVEFPKLADTLVDGTVSAWYKRVGDTVKRGEPLFAVETDKVNTDVESPGDGTLTSIIVPEGERADVGALLAEIDGPSHAELLEARPTETGVHTAVSRPIAPVTPAADGLPTMRRRIAERMVEARATITQGSCARLVDLSGIDRAGRSWTAFFVHALGVALGEERIGVAVEIPDGLVVPVIPNAATGSIESIAAAIGDIAKRARESALTAADMGSAAATVTNVGGTGSLMAFPMVAPGEIAILAPGAIIEGKAWISLCYDRARMNEYAAEQVLAKVVDVMLSLSKQSAPQ